MSVYTLHKVQCMPVSVEEAWDFFSNPANLQSITPTYLRFEIISKYLAPRMYQGQIIEYKVRPLLGIPIYWMTEITHVEEGKFFVDEQRYGPYSFWHHQHHFRAIEGGVEMTDIIHYENPLWVLGDIANALFVKNQLEGIFDFRYKTVVERFGAWKGKA